MSDDGYTRITLRIPDDLDERLNQSAKSTSKSKNAEIVSRLEQSLRTTSPPGHLELPRDVPIYWDESQLLAVAKHLHQVERTMEGKTISEIRDVLISRIIEVFNDPHRSTFMGEVECLWRNAYALGYQGRGRGEYADRAAIFLTMYIIPVDPEASGMGVSAPRPSI